MDQMRNESIAELELTSSQAFVLGYLVRSSPEPVYPGDIVRRFGWRHPTVSGILQRLEAKGYATKQRGAADGRQVNIRLTDAGTHAYIGYLFVQRKMINAVRKSIEDEDVAVLLRSLKGLNEFFSQKMEELK